MTNETCPFNDTAELSHPDHDQHNVDIVLSIISCIIFLIGIVGNILVIYIFKFQHSTRSVTEKLIIYLGVADLLGTLINSLVLTYARLNFTHDWHFGKLGCMILPSLQKITISVSIGIILLMAIYRCMMICQMYQYSLKLNAYLLLILVLSVLTRLPYAMQLKLKFKRCCGQMESTSVTLSILLAEDLIFIFIFSITLCFIYRTLYSKEKRKVLKNQLDHQRNKRVVLMVVLMAAIFLVTVLPRHLYLIIVGFQKVDVSYWIKMRIESGLDVFFMCNSICNPFIYGKLHTQFRRGVVKSIRVLSQNGRRLVNSTRRWRFRSSEEAPMSDRSPENEPFVLKRPLKERMKAKEKTKSRLVEESECERDSVFLDNFHDNSVC